ncbi:hypothetical protein [Hwangdonia seohaensis]|uniref:Uncharacterized protein n=1 Tax=Hwangdonia seohaensis TaxID=1240727 RepID=A0ABW3RFD7_9FLAO|nr:hypothetical protein [Hwangdonia seohaensis]
MQDNKNNGAIPQTHYYYGGYINFKAFRDYHLNNGLDDNYFKSNHCLVLAFIVEKFHKHDNTPHIIHNNKKYILVNTNFIVDNLIYLKVKSRTVKNYLEAFKKNNLISVEVRNENSRYVNVNSELIKLCYDIHYAIRPINFLQKNKPELWKMFMNEWEVYFESKQSFKKFVDDFNDTRDIEEYSYNTKTIYEHLLNSVHYHIYGKGKVRELKNN